MSHIKDLGRWALITVATMTTAAVLVAGSIEQSEPHSASMKAAIKDQEAALRMADRAQKVCGEQAAFALTDQPGEIVCITHNGKKSQIASIK